MKRNVTLQEISDGKLYTANDLVKVECGNCQGCSACCHGMGNSIVLDPLDVVRLKRATSSNFEALMQTSIELNVVDGLILPNMKMQQNTQGCYYLSSEGRCDIHEHRPGICRLFPLGRFYEEDGFKYFLQTGECKKDARSKVKVKKWLDTKNLPAYEKYINIWHAFIKNTGEKCLVNQDRAKEISIYVLNEFYINGFKDEENFFEEFQQKIESVKKIVQIN